MEVKVNKIVVVMFNISVLALTISLFAIFGNKNKEESIAKNIVLRQGEDYIQWKYADEDEDSWKDLVAISSLKGADGKDGREVQFKSEENKVYWKYNDEEEWTLLLDTSSTGKINVACETRQVIENKDEVDCLVNKTNCPAGTLLKINTSTSEHDEPLNFYVVKDTGTKLTLIADRNMGSDVQNFAWYSPNGSSTGNNTYGPIDALETLNKYTSTWDNICTLNDYTYENPGYINRVDGSPYKSLVIENGTVKITAGDDTVTVLEGTSRARMLTYEETVDASIGNCPHSGYCPEASSWLYDNLVYTNPATTPIGYWLLTSYTNAKSADVIVMKSGGAKIDNS